ncbi:hypothetical protein [Compostimonas suwonensis]|uniref:DUF1508 domain-containing protein n=1 Tax=Compostimonas suwonensis TaxID=1048394 RepID=A0A2M9C380_9MICO|nr:hypothetical protein [Compostimonas suwonensis]PJJ64990.1 hypothetical protein CLV54_0015 [Compostimonas suwonensis]
MRLSPRVSFSSFASTDDPQFAVWKRVNMKMLGGVDEEPQPRPGVSSRGPGRGASTTARREPSRPCGIWQLLASNNRELGRSARAYLTFAGASAHVRELQENAGELIIRVDSHRYLGTWFWYLEFEGTPVVTCVRTFGSAADAAHTASGAVLALGQAVLDESPRSTSRGRKMVRVDESAHASVW